jgi:short-subunit dehydrogenase
MPPAFNNQVAMITGAGSGIGRQLALELASRGAVIAAIDIRAAGVESLMGELKRLGGSGGWEIADVTDRPGLIRAATALSRVLGPVDLLVANAGIGLENPALTFDAEIFARQVAVNLQGVANSVAAVLPGMIERRRGHLVAIASLASYRGLPLMAGYCAAKAGVVALMDSLRIELRGRGISCTTICPGWVRTPLSDTIRFPKPNMMEVDAAAQRMVEAIRRRKAYDAFPLQERLILAGQRLLPAAWGDWLLRRYLRRMGWRSCQPAETGHG